MPIKQAPDDLQARVALDKRAEATNKAARNAIVFKNPRMRVVTLDDEQEWKLKIMPAGETLATWGHLDDHWATADAAGTDPTLAARVSEVENDLTQVESDILTVQDEVDALEEVIGADALYHIRQFYDDQTIADVAAAILRVAGDHEQLQLDWESRQADLVRRRATKALLLAIDPQTIGPGSIGRVYADATTENNGAYYVLADGRTWSKSDQTATEATKYYDPAEVLNEASGYRTYDTPNGYSGGRRIFQRTNTGAATVPATAPLSATNVLQAGWREISEAVASGSGTTYWAALKKTSTNTQTIDQALVLKLDAAPVATAGTALKFDVERHYGTTAAPQTAAAYTIDTTGAIRNMVVEIIHQAGAAPTFPAIVKKINTSGNYKASSVNYLLLRYLTVDVVQLTIYQNT